MASEMTLILQLCLWECTGEKKRTDSYFGTIELLCILIAPKSIMNDYRYHLLTELYYKKEWFSMIWLPSQRKKSYGNFIIGLYRFIK